MYNHKCRCLNRKPDSNPVKRTSKQTNTTKQKSVASHSFASRHSAEKCWRCAPPFSLVVAIKFGFGLRKFKGLSQSWLT